LIVSDVSFWLALTCTTAVGDSNWISDGSEVTTSSIGPRFSLTRNHPFCNVSLETPV
jgi:hypothetical protein